MVQLEGFVDRFIGVLLKTDLPLLKNALKSLAKIVLMQSRLRAAA